MCYGRPEQTQLPNSAFPKQTGLLLLLERNASSGPILFNLFNFNKETIHFLPVILSHFPQRPPQYLNRCYSKQLDVQQKIAILCITHWDARTQRCGIVLAITHGICSCPVLSLMNLLQQICNLFHNRKEGCLDRAHTASNKLFSNMKDLKWCCAFISCQEVN